MHNIAHPLNSQSIARGTEDGADNDGRGGGSGGGDNMIARGRRWC